MEGRPNSVIMQAMLCDHAQVADGKLFINGGGISRFYGPGLPPSTTIAALLLVPWDQTNEPIEIDLQLLDADGQAVKDNMGVEIRIKAQTEVGRPPGMEKGISIDLPITFHVGGMYLPAGRYMWKLTVGGETHEAWQLSFTVLGAPPVA